ncbi:MAG: MFS transporter [Spirochaetota bacterium]
MSGSLTAASDLRRSMTVSVASGAAGTLWMIACAPQAIFNVFVRNNLGATSAQLGLLVGILSFASILQLPSILIYKKLPRRKPFWIVTSVIHRLNGPVLAAVAYSVALGGSKERGIAIVFAAMIASWVITNLSSSGWWNWMADLVPIEVRARFFGRRSAVAQIVNIIAFFLTAVFLDTAVGDDRFFVYAIVFMVAGIGGVVDILLHVLIPEPRESAPPGADPAALRHEIDSVAGVNSAAALPARSGRGLAWFFEPVRDRNFLRFSVTTGIVLFSINVSAPFFAPYVTSPDAVGAPNTWLGIMFVISQTTWVAVASGWGTIMDRFGRKPVVMIGLLFTVSWIGYLVVSPTNYVVVLPMIAMIGGVLAPAFWDGINQLMLSLTRSENRLTYIAWYWTIIGVVSAGGSIVGGLLDDFFSDRSLALGPVTLNGFQVVVLTSLVLVGVSLLILSRIDEGPVKPVSFVFSRVATPGIFRTFMNIGVLARTDSSVRVARTLRSIDSLSDDIAVEQVIERVNDPDPEVREEAVRALGRLRSREAVDALIDLLSDRTTSNRVQAARALGRIGDERAVEALVEAMQGASDELREACAAAIGEIGGDASVRFLSELLRRDVSDSVAASGAEALSRHGAFEAAWEIVPRLHRTRNPVLRTQLAIALANVLGRPGEFYRYVTGSEEQQRTRRRKLLQEAERSATSTLGFPLPPISVEALEGNGAYEALQALHGLSRQASEQEERIAASSRLQLWSWFLARAVELERSDHQSDRAAVTVELLVALYFVRSAG